MSPGVSHSSSRTGTRTEYDDLDLRRTWTGTRRIRCGRSTDFRETEASIVAGARISRDSPSRMHVVLASVNFGVITKRRPGRPVARPSCYSPLSVYLALPPPFFPLFRAFTLSLFPSLFEIPTNTDRHRRICS